MSTQVVQYDVSLYHALNVKPPRASRMRQYRMVLHWVQKGYKPKRAARRVGLPVQYVMYWRKTDSVFDAQMTRLECKAHRKPRKRKPFKINRRQKAALMLWESGTPLKGVLEKIGIHINTLVRWKDNPLFRAAWENAAVTRPKYDWRTHHDGRRWIRTRPLPP